MCGLLVLAVALVFGQTIGHEFVNYDDGKYVYENPPVADGLTVAGVTWAFTHTHAANWHPLTWLSHMLDCQLYDLRPAGHHLTNVLLHAATAVLLFLVLRRMTGQLGASALTAAVFAIHPLRAESVAWVAERKDVLSGLFFMLTLAAYVEYVRRPFSIVRYLAVAVLFALGLMAKPMLVTLPLVLLLLDYWPLGRLSARCVLEKVPLAGLAALSCAVTLLAQTHAMAPNALVPWPQRIANAAVACAAYLGQLFWPVGLAAFYPHPLGTLPAWKVVGAVVVLACVSAVAFVGRRRCPYLVTGWLWYLAMLVPVIGLVQVGDQAMADRYTYLPLIGPTLAVMWAVGGARGESRESRVESRETRGEGNAGDRVSGGRARRGVGSATDERRGASTVAGTLRVPSAPGPSVANEARTLSAPWRTARGACLLPYLRGIVAAGGLAALMACAWRQTSYWHDSETLWRRALDCAPSARAHCNLGLALDVQGRDDEAIPHFQEALTLNPAYVEAHNNLGNVLKRKGRWDDAISHYEAALAVEPECAEVHLNLGSALVELGRPGEAIAHVRKASQALPGRAEVHHTLGNALMRTGQLDEAIAEYRQALRIKPDLTDVHNNLGAALCDAGHTDEAIGHYRQVLAAEPESEDAHNNLGNAYRQQGKTDAALASWRDGIRQCPKDAPLLDVTARVLATSADASVRNGAQAVELARRAVDLSGGRAAEMLDTLAAAYAEAGRFADAVEAAQRALVLAANQGNAALANAIRTRLRLYQAGSPLRATPQRSAS